MKTTPAVLWVLTGCASVSAGVAAIRPVDLRCEYLQDPLGVDASKPRLSWITEARQRGWMQGAYHILVASSKEQLAQDRGDLWDSGKVGTEESIHVAYAGKPLQSRMQGFWKVRVWDKAGEASGWSEAAAWSVGPLKPQDWTAKWITMKVDQGLPHPWLRRTFELKSNVKRAEVYVNTPAHYELYINGRKVGDDVLAPAHHQHKKRMLYKTFDVSSYLRQGRNCMALWMGPGWYQPQYGNPYKAPIVRVQLDAYSAEGVVTVGTDAQWRVADSCISQIDNWGWNHMGGERWDAGKYIKDWNEVTFDDSKWALAVEIPEPKAKVRLDRSSSPKPQLTASSSTPDYPPALAGDGSDSTRWVSSGNQPGMGPTTDMSEYLQFDYDQARSFAGLYLKPYLHCGPKDIEVQYSEDGKAYRTIQRATVGPDEEIAVPFEEIKAAHFRVVFLSSYPFRGDTSWNVQVAEIAILTREGFESSSGRIEQSWQAMPGSRMGAPIVAQKVYPHNGKWVVDFGTTLTGWMRLRMSELKPGQQITIDYSDLHEPALAFSKNQDGFQTFNQQDIYIAGTESEGVFCSKFNQHAFRYAVIAGLSTAPAPHEAEAMSVYSDLKPAGEFRCSNELFNQIHQITLKTTYTQIPCGALGGGEAREKLGYGDGGSFLSGMLYNLQSDAFFTKWLRDWCDNQTPDGFLGHTAPEFYPAGGGPSWGGEASELVRRLYVYYGDRRAIESAYATLKKYLDHLERNTQGEILRYFNPYKSGKHAEWYFLGDWTPPHASPDKHDFVFENELQREFFNNCYRVLLWEDLANYADAVGNKAEALRCRTTLAVIRPLIHTTYYDPAEKTYKANRQAYLTIALLARVVPEELRPAIFKQLEDDIVSAKKGHLDTGLQGTFMLLELLSRENRNDLVALMMNQTTFPGWGFLIKERKVTTWPETWSGWGSQIIQVVGTPGAWFYEGLAGIRPDPENPGFKHFTLRPGIVKSVDWVECRYRSPYGRIVGNWKREGEKLTMDVTIPANTTATVHFPSGDAAAVTEGGRTIDKVEGVKLLRMENGAAVVEVGAGCYEFVVRQVK